MNDYYYLLGISQTASEVEIKNAYRKLSKKFHPDVNQNDEYFSQRFKDIHRAYETLASPKLRSLYDKEFGQYYSPRSEDVARIIKYYFEHEKEISERRTQEKQEKKALETDLWKTKNRLWYQSAIYLSIILILSLLVIAKHIK